MDGMCSPGKGFNQMLARDAESRWSSIPKQNTQSEWEYTG